MIERTQNSQEYDYGNYNTDIILLRLIINWRENRTNFSTFHIVDYKEQLFENEIYKL